MAMLPPSAPDAAPERHIPPATGEPAPPVPGAFPARATRRWDGRRALEVGLALLLLLGVVGAWEAFVRLRGLSRLVLPGPLVVAQSFVEHLLAGYFWPHLGTTLSEILLGFLAGSLLGIGLGALVAQSALLYRVLNPYIIASQAMPKLALAPIFVVWFGFGIMPKVVITALIAFFPLFENTLTGLNEVDPDKLELFRALRATRWDTFTKLRLPNAVPYLFAGLRVAMVLSVVGAVVGEYVGANRGLGALIIAAQGTMDTPLMFAVFVLLTVVGVVLYQAVALAERYCTRWRYQ
jgi:NitT/TauT family transport system permease protein